MITAEQIIKIFEMKPLPSEGGYYAETYRSKEKIISADPAIKDISRKNLGTAILYLLTPSTFSALHRLKSDELFHFCLGDAVTMLQLHPDGSGKVITLGTDILNNQQIQVTVPKYTWQGSFLKPGGKFALMGCTVTPGFDFEDFELGRRDILLEQYPSQRDLIIKLTREK
jgi:predicted cupin superfamily sugar epimerase